MTLWINSSYNETWLSEDYLLSIKNTKKQRKKLKKVREMARGFNLEDTTDYYGNDKKVSSGLTKRQAAILRNRIEKNKLIFRERYGKRRYDLLAKVVREVINERENKDSSNRSKG